jgi:Na+/proline symporter
MGAAAPSYAPAPQNAYPSFLVSELPTVVSGIAIAGFFAIAQGSMDSAINALASSAIADIYVPLRRHLGYPENEHHPTEAPKLAVLLMGVVMVLFAIVCIALYGGQGKRTLIDFALGVMAFAYSGMLGVFLTALLTRRGNNASVIAALAAGVAAVALLQPNVIERWSPYILGHPRHLAGTWWMPIGTAVSFAVCLLGAPRKSAVGRGFKVTRVSNPCEHPQSVEERSRKG